ncbi:MAG: AraC family transcriptional regulator [Oscillospiraceae bacterium]|nr:AraC family transcriptional regulator [Oscillospiraceae bacterium]
MIILENFNAVLDYVEDHILEELDINHLAGIACCSVYDFQRTFSFAAEMSITEYIRKRRLTLAGAELRRDGIRVIDAALKYGYDSPVSFARTFQAFHGIRPSEAKKSNVLLKTFPRMKFQIYMKEVNEMRIIEKNKIILIGCLGKQDAGAVWGKWEEMTETYDITYGITDNEGNSAAYEVRFYTDGGEHIFAGVEVRQINSASSWEYLNVPAALYAIFEIDQKIDQRSQYDAVNKWLDENKTAYKRLVWDANGKVNPSEFVICQYDHRTAGKFKKDRIMEMWIPLEKTTS